MIYTPLDIDKGRINIDPGEITNLLGSGESGFDEHTHDIIEDLIMECSGLMEPRGSYVAAGHFPIESKTEIAIEGTRFRTGRIIRDILQGAESYAFFIATAGPGPEEYSRSLINGGNFLDGYIADLIGSAIAESVAVQIHEHVMEVAESNGIKTTNRYSPGYCGWDVTEQQKLFGLFPKGSCGVTLSGSSLMSPIKSVSGIIGMGTSVSYREYTCEICSMKDCIFRRTRSFTSAVD